MKDYYKILGLDRKATPTEIKRSFRKKALQTHPDKTNRNTKEEFMDVYEAYSILSDKKKRDRFDRLYDLFFDETTEINDEELIKDLMRITEKGQVYAGDFRMFKWQILMLLLAELLLFEKILWAAMACTFFGLWTIGRGIVNQDLIYTLVGLTLMLTGVIFGQRKIDILNKWS